MKGFRVKVLKEDNKTVTVQIWFDTKKGWKFTNLVIPKSTLKTVK